MEQQQLISGGDALLVIDPQNDFHPGGSLAVPGADEDARRIADFLRQHTSEIEDVVVTLDSHSVWDISHPSFWVDPQGKHPAPFTAITAADVRGGTWKAACEELQEHGLNYCESLEACGRFVHVIWPEHCLVGTPGHNVQPDIASAIDAWSRARRRAAHFVNKGSNPLTEHFSAFAAEVPLPDDPGTELNAGLVARLRRARRVFVCGQALSHCVAHSVRDLLGAWAPRRPGDVVLLLDGASPVPGFKEQADAFVTDMRAEGVTVLERMVEAEFPPKR